jgi:hypothetical protein
MPSANQPYERIAGWISLLTVPKNWLCGLRRTRLEQTA